MVNQEKLTEVANKVKKLLALSNSSNEHEAALAMSKVKEIMDSYNMQMTDVEIYTAEYGDKKVKTGYKQTPRWCWRLTSLVARNTYCRCLVGKTGVVFVGAKSDVEVAVYLYSYLQKTLYDMSRKYVSPWLKSRSLGELNSMKIAYIDGALISIAQKLKAEFEKPIYQNMKTASGSELMVVKNDALQKYWNNTYGNHSKGIDIHSNVQWSADNTAANITGRRDGQNIAIHKGLGGNGNGQKAIE